MRQSTLQWYSTVCATFWTISKCVQVLELALESNETRIREESSALTLKTHNVIALSWHEGTLLTLVVFNQPPTPTDAPKAYSLQLQLPVFKSRQFYEEQPFKYRSVYI